MSPQFLLFETHPDGRCVWQVQQLDTHNGVSFVRPVAAFEEREDADAFIELMQKKHRPLIASAD